MTQLCKNRWLPMALLLGLIVFPLRVQAQDYTPVEISELKSNPQRYWAKGIVFRDVLVSAPKDKTLKIDGRRVTQFFTGKIGEMYAENTMLETLRELPLEKEYLFSGTVGQRNATWWRKARYYVIVQNVAPIMDHQMDIGNMLDGLNLENTTNIYNMALVTLQGIMREVEKDLYGYAGPQNLTVKDLFDTESEHYSRISSSVRTVLRKVEDRSKMPLNEYLVNLIISMMAIQSGYGEPVAKRVTVVESSIAPAEVISLEESDRETTASPESWDLSQPEPVEEVVEPSVATEETPSIETPINETNAPVTEAVTPEVTVETPDQSKIDSGTPKRVKSPK